MPVVGGNAINHGMAYEGMPSDGQLYNHISRLNNTAAPIPYGSGVVTDLAYPVDGVMIPQSTSTAAKFVGVVVRELNRAYGPNETFGAPVDRELTVRTAGPIWVKALTNVSVDDPVYLVVGDGANQGRFSNAAGTGATAGVLIPNAKWISAAQAGGLAEISLVIGG